MKIIFEKGYLEELYTTGKAKSKKYSFPPEVVRKYIETVDKLRAANRIEDLFIIRSLHYEHNIPKYPTHPGTLIKDELIEMGDTTQKELASSLGVTPSYLSEVINGKRAINASLALGLEEIFGISAEYWLRFQVQYDLDMLRIARINKPRVREPDQLSPKKEFIV